MTATTDAGLIAEHEPDGSLCCGECAASLRPGAQVCPACWAPAGVPGPAAAGLAAEQAAGPGELDELDGVPSVGSIPQRPMIPLDLPGIPLVIPRADVTLAYGAGAIGKGRMTWAIIAAVTRSGGDVIVVMPEDKQDEQMAARCAASGAAGPDVAGRVWDMTRLPGSAVRFKLSAAEKTEGDISHLRAFIERLQGMGRDPRLVVIDPISAVVGWGTMLTVAGARRLIEPLQDLADVTGVAVLAIAHCTKDGKLAGSAGLAQALRLVYKVAVDAVNAAFRVIEVEKANNLPPGVDGLKFTVAEDGEGRARVEWLTRAALDSQRTRWRDRLAAREAAHAPTGPAPAVRLAQAGPVTAPMPAAGPDALYSATYAVAGRGVQGAESLGIYPSLAAARAACQGSPQAAGAALAWESAGPGQWLAPGTHSGHAAVFAIVGAPGRQAAAS